MSLFSKLPRDVPESLHFQRVLCIYFPIIYMKVLTIGSDRKLFETQSAVLLRSIEYAKHMEELHIVIFTQKSDNLTPVKNGNLFLYPTCSESKLGYVFDAYSIGKKIIPEHAFVRGKSVISAQDPFESGLVGYWLSRKFRLPLQLQIHTDFLSLYFKNNFLNRLRSVIASFLVPRAEGLRVVSKRIAQSLLKRFNRLKTQPEILPIFVDMVSLAQQEIRHDLRLQFPQFNFIFLMASRLTQEKNIDTALHAFAHVVKKFPSSGLFIAGSGPEEQHLRSVVISLHLEEQVVFMGWQDDLVSLYKNANTYLLTSFFEGYGMAFIEAAATGIPIITTPVGVAETVCRDGENAFVCPIGDVECFTTRMEQLVMENATRELFKRRIRDSIQSMASDRDEYIAKYIGLLEVLQLRITQS